MAGPVLFLHCAGGTGEPATASELPVETNEHRQPVPNLGIDSNGDQELEGLIVFKAGRWFHHTNVPIRSLSAT